MINVTNYHIDYACNGIFIISPNGKYLRFSDLKLIPVEYSLVVFGV